MAEKKGTGTKIIRHRVTNQVKELPAIYANELLRSRSWYQVDEKGKPLTKADGEKAQG